MVHLSLGLALELKFYLEFLLILIRSEHYIFYTDKLILSQTAFSKVIL